MNKTNYTGNFLPRKKKRKRCRSCAQLTHVAHLNLNGQLYFCDACQLRHVEVAAPQAERCDRCGLAVYARFVLCADAPALCRNCLHVITTLTAQLTAAPIVEEVTL